MTPKQIHGAMANYAKKRGWKKFPSYSAVAAALSKRPTPTDPLSCPGIDGGEY
jgi:hypothetical protein